VRKESLKVVVKEGERVESDESKEGRHVSGQHSRLGMWQKAGHGMGWAKKTMSPVGMKILKIG
jgi:hypothetical protein